jgi:hypothetical protein
MSYVSADDQPNPTSQAMSEHLRLVATRSDFVEMRAEAAKLMRRPLQPRTLVMVGVASGFAAAMGVSAIVAFLFFVLVPNQVNAMATEAAASEHLTVRSAGTADITSEESRVLLEKFRQYLALAPAGTAEMTHVESQALLGKFVHWQQSL